MSGPARSIAGVHAAARSYLAATLGRGMALATVAGLALFLVLAWLLAGSGGWRPGSPLPLLLDGAALLVGVAILLRGRRLVLEALQERRVSRAMEVAAGLSEGDVQGALELGRTIPPGVSPALVARGERHLLGSLEGDVAALTGAAGDGARRLLRRAGWAAFGSVTLAGVLGVAFPERAQSAWMGLLRPAAVLAGPTLPPVQVSPGTVELDRGSDLVVRVEAPLRDQVTLVWQVAGDVVRRQTLALDDGVGGHRIAAVTAETSYHVEAPDGARSPTYTAVPVDPLFVTDVTLRLAFPSHTGRVDEEYRGEVPPLRVPAGTEVAVEGRGNRLLSSAELRWAGNSDTVSFRVTGTDFQGRWVPRRSGRGSWHFVDADGDPAEVTPPELEVEVVPDAAPRVRVAQPARDTVLPLGLRQPLVVQASDDYGVAWLELVAWRVTGLGEARPPVTQRIDAGGVPRVLVRPVMDVSGWELLPGDEVRWFVRVADNGPAAQEARTPEHVLRMPDAEELRREAGRELDAAAGALEELQAQAREAAETAREARRQAAAPERAGPRGAPGQRPESGEVDFGSREELRRALEDEAARARQADSLAQALSEMSSSLSEAGAQDARLRSDLEELRSLLDELGGEEMQERIRELLSAMDEVDRAEARRALGEMAERGEEAEARLEEAVERMRRAAARQQFATATDEASDLARREEALARALGEEASPERARQQEALAREAGELERRMEELAGRLDQLGETEAARGVQNAREGVQGARQGMQEAARQAQAGQGQAAAGAGQEAAEQMEESAREMMEAREQMMRERAEAFRRALQQTVQDALALAERQGELRELMRRADRTALAALRAEVAAVQAGTANATRNLGLAARAARAGGGEREISATLGAALGELERTVTALDNPSAPGIPSPQVSAQRALERLNQAALQALAASRALSQGGQGQPSAEETMEQLQQLAQEQAEVNNQASQLMPMELTPQAMQEQMQQLAQQQQQVASNVGQMSEQEGEGPLGDLEAMAREAEALARELEQGRLDGTTRERQERLFHRLLDAGRSLEKEEESTERESEAPGVVEPGSVLPLDAAALGILRFRPDAEALRRLPPAARALVVRYFQRLNEGGSVPPAAVPPAATPPGGGR